MLLAIHLSVAQWVGIGFFVVLGALASTRIRAIWNGDTKSIPTYWARALPTFFVVGWVMILAIPVVVVVVSQSSGTGNPLLAFLLLLLLAFIAVGTLVGIAAALTGHPRAVVPPSLRVGRHNGGGIYDER